MKLRIRHDPEEEIIYEAKLIILAIIIIACFYAIQSFF